MLSAPFLPSPSRERIEANRLRLQQLDPLLPGDEVLLVGERSRQLHHVESASESGSESASDSSYILEDGRTVARWQVQRRHPSLVWGVVEGAQRAGKHGTLIEVLQLLRVRDRVEAFVGPSAPWLVGLPEAREEVEEAPASPLPLIPAPKPLAAFLWA